MTADEVLKEIILRAGLFGVAVIVSPEKYVLADGIKCGGYFDAESPQKIIAVAWGRDEQVKLGILLHEYCHLTQWIEGTPLWAAASNDDRWTAWLEGKPARGVQAAIVASRELEADCERRAIRLARELCAPIDLERYARGANAYLHFHNVMAVKRKWYRDGLGPYEHPEVMALCNPTLDKDFSKTPKALFDAIAARLA